MALRSALLPALAAFASAARHQNIAHAAQELNLTASAVSHQVRKLEALLGVTLFRRLARGVALTREGRLLADAAGAALSDLDGVVRSLRHAPNLARVRISLLPSLATIWLVPRLAGFSKLHPGIRLSIDTDRALTRFDDNGPDFGIRYGPGQWPGLTARFLMDDEMFPAASPKLAGLAQITDPAQIASLPLISDLGLEGWREWFRAAGVRNVRPAEMHSFSDSSDALAAARAGLGAVLARKRLAAAFLSSGQLVRLPGPMLPARYAYYVVHAAHRRLSAPASTFVAWLEREVLNSDADGSEGASPPVRRTRTTARRRSGGENQPLRGQTTERTKAAK